MPYWIQTDLENRIGVESLAQFLDDDNDGVVDPDVIARLSADADSYIEGALIGIYDIVAAREQKPNRLVQLSLDAAVMILSQRRVEFARADWMELKKALDSDLDKIRKGIWRLDIVGPPEPAANEGGSIGSGSSSGSFLCTSNAVFLNGLGDF